MIVYAVFKEGVYRHDCEGIFTGVDAAVAIAVSCSTAEEDGYHEWKVFRYRLDADNNDGYDDNEVSNSLVATVSRKRGGEPVVTMK